jgi:hypothetical protein
MPGKRSTSIVLVLAIALVLSFPVFSEDERPEAFSLIIGPRIGGSYVLETPESFTSSVSSLYSGNYFPAVTLFGVTVEERILLGQTKSHFAFQEVLLIGGLEQGIALPEGAFLIGYRDFSGFELGVGPILHIGGIGVVAAIGWTFSFRGAFIPVDISFVFPNADRPPSISVTTGFNFQVSRSENLAPQQQQPQGGTQQPQGGTQQPQGRQQPQGAL